MPSFRKSTPEDAFSLAKRLRKSDLDELLAAGARSPVDALLSGIRPGAAAVSVVDDNDRALLMFGVVPHPLEPMVGLIWALASTEVRKHRRMFITHSPEWIDGFQTEYPILTNFTDCRNTEHHRWLRWCGFTFIRKVNGLGPGAYPFYEFVRIRSENV